MSNSISKALQDGSAIKEIDCLLAAQAQHLIALGKAAPMSPERKIHELAMNAIKLDINRRYREIAKELDESPIAALLLDGWAMTIDEAREMADDEQREGAA